MLAIFSPLANITIEILKFFYSLVPNYGVAIIFVTILMKFALYPLTLQSTKQMAAMQKLQPKLQDLQKKRQVAAIRDLGESLQRRSTILLANCQATKCGC